MAHLKRLCLDTIRVNGRTASTVVSFPGCCHETIQMLPLSGREGWRSLVRSMAEDHHVGKLTVHFPMIWVSILINRYYVSRESLVSPHPETT